jgi:hypothetical protein
MDAHFRSFEKEVLPVLVKEKIGVLGMKPFASGTIMETKTVSAIECLHYALNLADIGGDYRDGEHGTVEASAGSGAHV